jgi:hypothetical protein
LQSEFYAFVRERQGCSQDQDCVKLTTWCPFGTAVSVATRYREAVEAKYEQLAADFAKVGDCKYKAAAHGPTICLKGQCDFAPLSFE